MAKISPSKWTFFRSLALLAIAFSVVDTNPVLSFEEIIAEMQCAPLAISKSGVVWDAHTSAGRYSDTALGRVGISIFPGGDLVNFTAHELGLRLVGVLKERDAEIEAKCFVNNSYFPDNGTGIGFVVNGVTLKIDGEDNFGLTELRDNKRILNIAVAEVVTGRLLLSK